MPWLKPVTYSVVPPRDMLAMLRLSFDGGRKKENSWRVEYPLASRADIRCCCEKGRERFSVDGEDPVDSKGSAMVKEMRR